MYQILHCKGVELFKQGQYSLALDQFNQAIDIVLSDVVKSGKESYWIDGRSLKGREALPYNVFTRNCNSLYDHGFNKYPNLKVTLSCKASCYQKLQYPFHAEEIAKSALPLDPSYQPIIEKIFNASMENNDVEGFSSALYLMKFNKLDEKKFSEFEKKANEKIKDMNKNLTELKKQVPQYDLIYMTSNKLNNDLFNQMLDKLLEGKASESDFFQRLISECDVCNVEVRKTEEKGFSLFATKNIKKDEIILRENPFMVGVVHPTRNCACCGKLLTKERINCKNNFCDSEYYCSIECRESAWKSYHSTICGFDSSSIFDTLKKSTSSGSRNMLFGIKVMSLIQRKKFKMDEEFEKETVYGLQLLRLLSDSKISKISATNFVNFLSNPLKIFEELSTLVACGCSSKVSNNSFSDGPNPCNVSTVNRLISFANHSCCPNARYRAEEPLNSPLKANLIAKNDIKKGEEVLISYVETTGDPEKRGLALLQYQFVCRCDKCIREGVDKFLEKNTSPDCKWL